MGVSLRLRRDTWKDLMRLGRSSRGGGSRRGDDRGWGNGGVCTR